MRELRIEVSQLAEDGSPEAINALADMFVHSANKELSRQALKVLLTFAAEDHPEAQEALCRLVIDYDQPLAKEIVLATGYTPRDLPQRALFYFLTEQWEKYESLDFDQSLLKAIYPHIPLEVRNRLIICARQAGRLDFISVVTETRRIKSLGEMTEEEWHTTLTVLNERKAWEEMWRLVQTAPAIWSLALLLRLKKTGWMPKTESEQPVFTTLLHLAEHCEEQQNDILKEAVPCFARLEHPDGVSCVAISPDGKMLATGSFDATVRLWSLPGGNLLNTLRDHSKWVNSVVFSQNGRLLISGGFGWRDKPVRIWSLPEGIVVHRVAGPPQEVTCLAIQPGEEVLALAGRRGKTSIRFWSLKKGKDVEELEGHPDDISGIAFSPDGRFLASGSQDQTVRVWHVADEITCKVLEGHTDRVECVAISPDGNILASGSRDNTLRLWSLPQGALRNALKAHSNWVKDIIFSPDGSLLVSGSSDHTVRLWSAPDGKLRQTLSGHSGTVMGVVFSPDGCILASCSDDHSVRLWDVWKLHIHRLLGRLPHARDINFIESILQQKRCTLLERKWLEFILILLRWHQRFDIEVAENPHRIPVGNFDIEIK